MSISIVSCKENASLHFGFAIKMLTLHQFHNESTAAMTRVIFLITIKMCFFSEWRNLSGYVWRWIHTDDSKQLLNFFFKKQKKKNNLNFLCYLHLHNALPVTYCHVSQKCVKVCNHKTRKLWRCLASRRRGWGETLTPKPGKFKLIKFTLLNYRK